MDYESASEMYNWYQILVQDLKENLDENLAQLTQNTEDPKSNQWIPYFPHKHNKCDWPEL